MLKHVEFYIGVVGGLFGVLNTLFYGQYLHWLGDRGDTFVTLLLVAHVLALGISCFVTKVPAVIYGAVMCVVGVMSLGLFSLGLFVPAVLEIISGVLAFRKMKIADVK